MIKFRYTILYVQDVAKTIDFYERAFGLLKKFITPDGSYAELISGDTTLSFASVTLANSNLSDGFTESSRLNKPFGMEIGLVANDVEAAVNSAVKEGAMLIEQPKTKPWGQVVAYVRDIDGFLIEICSEVES
jgi:lactoylglutathione lyase